MKLDYINLLTKIVRIAGVSSVSLLFSLPSGANEALNPNPSIFTEYSSTTTVPTLKEVKKITPAKILAQRTNPKPSIFDECPYNRAACEPTPGILPTQPAQPGIPTTPPGVQTPTTPPGAGTQNQNIVALAGASKDFTILTSALKAAGLAETLQAGGPFTVFAPTDAAFAKLPQDAVRDLLKPENKEVLVKILRYHVVPGQVLASDLKSGEVKSVEGGPINVKVDAATGVMVNDARVVQPDIKASNGVIHAIDQVILPPDL